MKQTRGQLEAELSRAVIQFAKEHLGRGPEEARAHVFQDVVFIRLSGVLTRAEQRLAGDYEGARLIKELRLRLLDSEREHLEAVIAGLTGCSVINQYADLSTTDGEQIIVFILDRDLDNSLGSGKH